jgi:predicted RNase H-related nuclease YkuK (DUF458 family)
MNETITFAESLSCSQELLQAIESGELKQTALVSAISTLISTENGARGFFVTYLTDDVYGTADKIREEVIEALKTSPEIVSDLLVKNIAMSTAMELTHLRNKDQEQAMGSQRVQERTLNLIKQLGSEEIKSKLLQLETTLVNNGGVYQDFLERWQYDQEQKAKIADKIRPLIEPR